MSFIKSVHSFKNGCATRKKALHRLVTKRNETGGGYYTRFGLIKSQSGSTTDCDKIPEGMQMKPILLKLRETFLLQQSNSYVIDEKSFMRKLQFSR